MTAGWQAERVSVVVPTYNRAATLARVLAGFADQTLPADQFEVIVVDDGSTDTTPALLAEVAATVPYRLTGLRQANQGPAAARNRGLAAARGPVVVFVDDDCLPTPGLLAAHRAAHEVEGLAVIGRILWHPDLPVTPLMDFLSRSIFTYEHARLPLDAPFICYYTGNASVHRASAMAIGGFDETFPRAMHEDIDFAYRLRRHGVRIVFAADAVVWHDRPADLPATLANQHGKGREMLRLWRKYPELHEFTPLPRLRDPSWSAEAEVAMARQAHAAGTDKCLTAPDAPPDPSELVAGHQRPDPRLVALLDKRERLRAVAAALQARVCAQRDLETWQATLTAEINRHATEAAVMQRTLTGRQLVPGIGSGSVKLVALAKGAGRLAWRLRRQLVRPTPGAVARRRGQGRE